MNRSFQAACQVVSLVAALVAGALVSSGVQRNLDCGDFRSRAEAQASLDANPSDPDGLDRNNDGVACEDHDYADGSDLGGHPATGTPSGAATPSPLASPAGGPLDQDGTPSGDLDCADFSSQEAAQAEYDADPSDPNGLDGNDNGEACEDYDYRAGVDQGADSAHGTPSPAGSPTGPLAADGDASGALACRLTGR